MTTRAERRYQRRRITATRIRKYRARWGSDPEPKHYPVYFACRVPRCSLCKFTKLYVNNRPREAREWKRYESTAW